MGTSCDFLKNCYAGDTLYTALEIVALSTSGAKGHVVMAISTFNQDGDLVLTGEQRFTLRLS